MAKASDNVFPRLLISEGGSTTTPASGNVTVYAKADGLLYSKDDAGAETLVSGGAGGGAPAAHAASHESGGSDEIDVTGLTGAGGGGAVGRAHLCVPFGFVHDRAPTADNIAVDACWAVPIVVEAPLILDHLRYQSRDASGARSLEFALYYDDGTANAVKVAHGSESFTAAGTALRTPAFDSAPVSIDPGSYWFVVRNSHVSATLGIGFQVLDTSLIIRQMSKGTIGALSGATLDLSTGWTRTSANIPHVALVGRVFGEGSAF